MRRNGFTWIEVVVVLLTFGILASILMPTFQRTHCNGRTESCHSNLKQIGLGVQQYIKDYDEKFPPVAVSRSGYWAGSLQPYVKTWKVFQCPSAPKDQSKTTDYFYNARVAAVELRNLPSQSQTILAGDGTDDSPLNYALFQLSTAWLQDKKSPPWRHVGGATYLFADSHAKWLKPEQISVQSPTSDAQIATFALK